MEKIGLKIEKVNKFFRIVPAEKNLFEDFSLEVLPGEFLTIFGPNGSGKTTLLNIISGLLAPDAGLVDFSNQKSKPKISYIFQNYRESLFPWMKIYENIAYPLKIQGLSKKQRLAKVEEICKRFAVDLDLEAYPYRLSGGQQQLVAILRGLIDKPEIILMDEPFASLDYQTTLQSEQKLQEIWQEIRTTTIFVSHDLRESILLADRIVLFGKNKPTKIISIVDNKLTRPRKTTTITSSKFIEIEKKILKLLED